MHVFIASQVFGLQVRSYRIDWVAEDVQSSDNVWGGKVCFRLYDDCASPCMRRTDNSSFPSNSLLVRPQHLKSQSAILQHSSMYLWNRSGGQW